MKQRNWIVPAGVVALAAMLATTGTLGAQVGTSGRSPAVAASAASGSAVARTPWGDPDVQGVWTSEPELGVPFERSPDLGDRQTLTEAEFAKRQKQAAQQLQTDNAEFDVETAETANAGAVGSATSPPPHWLERGKPSYRTSMVIDPPNGRIPPVTAEARARAGRGVRGSFGNGPFNSHEDFTLYDRCITRGVPAAIYPAIYNANTRLVQGPGFVAITYEMIHETRVIPIDNRPHLPSNVKQYLGDARAHWDGDTLVIETTNFLGKTAYRNATEGLKLTERFRRVDAETLRYEMTVDDPATWTRPWTAALNMKPQENGMFEYACPEVNMSMRNMLSAARAADNNPAAAPPGTQGGRGQGRGGR
jgi:hypothetical protein